MKFKDLRLSKEVLETIKAFGYDEPTKIQELAIPLIMNKKDVLGIAQTGTGKTAAFALPIIDKLLNNNNLHHNIKALVISPTRELAIQIKDNINNYSNNTKISCGVILGGVKEQSQIRELKKGLDILVATPGRLVDLAKRKYIDLSSLETLVLDEADTMLDMGFINDIKYVIEHSPKNRQTLLFSATMPDEIKKLSNKILNHPESVITTPVASTVPKVKQYLYCLDKSNKLNLLLELLSNRTIDNALIFTRTKHGANRLAEYLTKYGIKVETIHGNKTQPQRQRALTNFKNGKVKVLIATDIASRGIDIVELSHVINYDMPEQPELYVHRIGRTARAGLEGVSISFCTKEEKSKLYDIERLINQKIEIINHPEYSIVFRKKKDRSKENKTNDKLNKKVDVDNNKKVNNYSSSRVNSKNKYRNHDKNYISKNKRKNIKHDL